MNGKTTDVTNPTEAAKAYSGLKVTGNGDLFTVLSKASFAGARAKCAPGVDDIPAQPAWMKSTKAMFVGNGSIVQVSTQINNPDGTHAVAEALTYVPGAMIVEDINGGKKLVPIH